MFRNSIIGLLSLAVAALAMLATAQASCLGVSRTINISSFKSSMGANPSGGIGLRHKEVVLTFDDGPMPGKTPRILSALAAECTRATFFMVGNMARAYPSLVRRVALAGHTVAHHTQSHAHLPGSSPSHARAQIGNGVAMVNKALGPLRNRSSRLFRYPYLARSASLDSHLRKRRLLPFSANIDSTDWKPISAQSVVNRVMSQLKARGRGVILLHDIQSRTASALPVLLDRLKAGGYKVVHVRAGNVSAPAMASLGPSKKARKKAASSRGLDRRTTASIRRGNRDVKSNASGKPRKTLLSRWLEKRRKDKVTPKTTDRKKTAKKRIASVSRKKKKNLTWLEKRRAASLARSKKANTKSKKSARLSKRASKKDKSKRKRFSLFRSAVKRKPGESMESYHHRVKVARAKAKK